MPTRQAACHGSFADPSFPTPTESGYDWRRHPWIAVPDTIESGQSAAWESLRPLHEAHEYAEVADRARELLEAHPDDALEHLGRAIELFEGIGEMENDDSDFDPIRDKPAFKELVS
jgi:hypothetical protein